MSDLPNLDAARAALATAERDIQNAGPWEKSERLGGRGTPIRHLRDALAAVDALTARLAEAEATLANERGYGPPPSDGWMWNMHARYWFRPGATVHWADMGRAWWWSDSHGANASDPRCGPHATARAAMKAADATKVSKDDSGILHEDRGTSRPDDASGEGSSAKVTP